MNAHPDSDIDKIWLQYCARFAPATLLLAIFVVTTFVGVLALALSGRLSYWVAVPVLVITSYVGFTPVHEAVHGNIFSERRWSWANDVVGWAVASCLLVPFPAFRALHLRHHARTNRGPQDPDYWVAGRNPISVTLRCLTILPHYYLMLLGLNIGRNIGRNIGKNIGSMGKETPQLRRARRISIAFLIVAGLIVAALVMAGYLREVVFLWLVPTTLATGMLALVFDWLPHRPHTETDRYKLARTYVGPAFELLTCGHSYHLVHHLWAQVPFYHYGRLFWRLESHLRERGAPISVIGPPLLGAGPRAAS